MDVVFSQYVKSAAASTILICDDLHALNQLMVLRYKDEESALRSARLQGDRMRKQVINSLRRIGIDTDTDIRVLTWQQATNTKAFASLFKNIARMVESDDETRQMLESFVSRHNAILRRSLHENAETLERDYILNEIAMSIFMTEIEGYPAELWEAAPDPGLPDPLRFLYSHKASYLKQLTGKQELKRRLIVIRSRII